MPATATHRDPAVMWFRRDLRLADHPALVEAAAAGPVLPLFVLDPRLLAVASDNRLAYLAASLRSLDEQLDGRLVVRSGRPEQVVPRVVAEVGAGSVHVSADFAPYGAARDRRVEDALGEVPLTRTGSPYAVSPGRVRTRQGSPYQVFTPFLGAWTEHGWRAPAGDADPEWVEAPSDGLPDFTTGIDLPEAGEPAALARWEAFLDERIGDYPDDRDRPDRPGTSFLSPALRWGEIHPRTLLADLAPRRSEGAARFRAELAWREFHADQLWHHPRATHEPLQGRFARMEYDDPGPAFDAWAAGRTGFPIVDAGMRQLLATGWMHNRVRMVTASFLVKDLHVHWWYGARHFLRHLVDGDVAQNQLNWQWVAGCGADASPWFRVFNPTTQGRKFDPDGSYVRRWVPELAEVPARHVHEPHRAPVPPADYPAPIVDHAEERREALARLERMSA